MTPPPDPSPYHTAEQVYFEVELDSGSLPPPYHFTTKIIITTDGAGLFEMTPDYGFNNPPHWQMSFDISSAQLTHLVALFQSFQNKVEPASPLRRKNPGAEQVTLRYGVHNQTGERVISPDQDQNSNESEFISALYGLVPENIENDLLQRRDQYIADYLAGKRK
jgi:hypothetical protein